jgi:hypothetical protein
MEQSNAEKVALEMRFERVFQIWAKVQMQGLDNVLTLVRSLTIPLATY